MGVRIGVLERLLRLFSQHSAAMQAATCTVLLLTTRHTAGKHGLERAGKEKPEHTVCTADDAVRVVCDNVLGVHVDGVRRVLARRCECREENNKNQALRF